MNLDKKIDEYSEQLFADLGLTNLPEEGKADIYARVQEHLHKSIQETLKSVLRSPHELVRIGAALEQENYKELSRILKKYPQYKTKLEEEVEKEFQNLKAIITEEQKYAGTT